MTSLDPIQHLRSADQPQCPRGGGTPAPHVSNVLMKLRLRDRVHAVIFAYESGLLQTGKGLDLGA